MNKDMNTNKKYDTICDQCGGMMTYTADRKELHCEYCGNVVILPSTEEAEKIAYAKRKAEIDAHNEEYNKRVKAEKKRLNISKLIALLIVFTILGTPFVIALTTYIFRPVINPFEYIEVNFEGIDGEGVAEIELIKTDRKIKTLEDLSLTIAPKYELSEGDIISVSADPIEGSCWFNPGYKEYTVEGLRPYLTDLMDIDENAEKLIHQKSLQILDGNIYDTPQVNTLKPVKFYLLSDGKKQNCLYDVFSATWNLADGTDKTVYLVAYYENIMVNSGENATFDYDDCMYCGDILSTSDYRNNVVCGYDSLEDIELDLNTNRDPNWSLTSK